MKSIKAYIPNSLTCCNFLCGAVATIFAAQSIMGGMQFDAFSSLIPYSLLLIIGGAVFDFFDGMSARLLGVSSPIGKELDSLADATTFGLAPATILTAYINFSTDSKYGFFALFIAAASILRLAKFNLDERQTTSFIGLATPANALFCSSLISALIIIPVRSHEIGWTLFALIPVSCYLLNSEIPFFSLKFHDLKWATNRIRFIFIIGSAVILLVCLTVFPKIFGFITEDLIAWTCLAIHFIILYYIILALGDDLTELIRAKKRI